MRHGKKSRSGLQSGKRLAAMPAPARRLITPSSVRYVDSQLTYTSRPGGQFVAAPLSSSCCSPFISGQCAPAAVSQSFFLTAKVLHLGPVAVLAFRNRLMKQLQRTEEEAKVLERMLPRCGSGRQYEVCGCRFTFFGAQPCY